MFSSECCQIFTNTFFIEHPQWFLFRFDERRLVYVREDTPSEHLTKHLTNLMTLKAFFVELNLSKTKCQLCGVYRHLSQSE